MARSLNAQKAQPSGALRDEPIIVLDAAEDGECEKLSESRRRLFQFGVRVRMAWIACDGRARL